MSPNLIRLLNGAINTLKTLALLTSPLLHFTSFAGVLAVPLRLNIKALHTEKGDFDFQQAVFTSSFQVPLNECKWLWTSNYFSTSCWWDRTGFDLDFSLNHKFNQTSWHLRWRALLRIHFPPFLLLWRHSSESWSRSKLGAIAKASRGSTDALDLTVGRSRALFWDQTLAAPQGLADQQPCMFSLQGEMTLLAFRAKL